MHASNFERSKKGFFHPVRLASLYSSLGRFDKKVGYKI